MPIAVTLRLDPVNAASIVAMRRSLSADCIAIGLEYPAHITLAIYPDEVSGDRLLVAFAKLTAAWQVLEISLCGFGVFPGPPAILYLAPVASRDLLTRQAMLCDALPGLPVHPHYRPGAWVPHITLSDHVPHPELALKSLLAGWRPMTASLDRSDLVRFHPLEVMTSNALPAADRAEEWAIRSG
jgi:hypothetical protein